MSQETGHLRLRRPADCPKRQVAGPEADGDAVMAPVHAAPPGQPAIARPTTAPTPPPARTTNTTKMTIALSASGTRSVSLAPNTPPAYETKSLRTTIANTNTNTDALAALPLPRALRPEVLPH
jgi:hypothetical protein